MEWNYAHEADITIGEVHISKVAKILLICLCVILAIGIGVTIYFRKYITDYIANPSIQLSTSTVDVEVYSEFDANKYIANLDKINNKVTYEVVGEVDTTQLGVYTLEYISKNRAHSNSTELTVNVVDTTPPEIVLANGGTIILIKDSEEFNNFNAEDYVLSVSDNFDTKPKLEYSTLPTLKQDTETGLYETREIIYSASDSSNNRCSAKLTIITQEDYEALINSSSNEEELAELQRQLEEQQRKIDEQNQEIEKQRKELEEKQNQPTPTPTKPSTPETTKTPTSTSDGGGQTGTDPEPPTETKKPTETHYDAPKDIYVTVSAAEGRSVASNKIKNALENAGYQVGGTGDFTAGVIPGKNQYEMTTGSYDLSIGDVTVHITVTE